MKRFSQTRHKILAIVLLLFILSLVIPTPYYLYQPGSVEELASKVEVEGGKKDAEGNLYLTTVLSLKASNIYYLLYGMVAPYTDIRKVKDVRGEMTDKEYNRLLQHMMNSSKQTAYVAGLRAAGEDVEVVPNGILVRNIQKGTDAKEKLQIGDIIREIDDTPYTDANDMITYLGQKQEGDKVKITFERDGIVKTEEVELVPLQNATNKVGLGIVVETLFNVEASREVKINSGRIGGPSAGLMFALEIYNQATSGDITKGYEIAGTGTIDFDGNVGQIGSIQEKIVAVEKAGIDIFFCPADIHEYDRNTKDVMEVVEKEGFKVKVVPVKTLQDAIDYLESLPPKQVEGEQDAA